ncbi:hypothetical protein Taro_005298 [Colocasia esculenta]|uniref:Uncharacterized protein n=1 Tax=Colocasia esculenta TaxID=4460 RepID=A0A843TTZ2_COLES|nr:hypothetical protein [Colocasia esculenta]
MKLGSLFRRGHDLTEISSRSLLFDPPETKPRSDMANLGRGSLLHQRIFNLFGLSIRRRPQITNLTLQYCNPTRLFGCL